MAVDYDASAIASDIPRSHTQYWMRKTAALAVKLLRLNSPAQFTTELVQQIRPVCKVQTKFGQLLCRGGHGRLVWRAKTFYTEEPETIKWLESFQAHDVFWDIGANVGLYSIYAAKSAQCEVLAVEPEAQNYGLLVENIVLNSVQQYVKPTCIAVAEQFGLGCLSVHDLTKGGAYNQFVSENSRREGPKDSLVSSVVQQLQVGASIDDLVDKFGLKCPTRIKIDVDGIEPDIIKGGLGVLERSECRDVLVEIQRDDDEHVAIIETLRKLGFHIISERSNWESRDNRESENACTNIIFSKD